MDIWEYVDKPRPPNKNYNIRKIASSGRGADAFAITVPQNIALLFVGVKFSLVISGNSLIYTSGCVV